MNVYDGLNALVWLAEACAIILTLAVVAAVLWALSRFFGWLDRLRWKYTALAAAEDDLPDPGFDITYAALDHELDTAFDQIRDLYADERGPTT